MWRGRKIFGCRGEGGGVLLKGGAGGGGMFGPGN